MRIFTWNTDGDFTEEQKFNVIGDLFNKYFCCAGMIQEGGVRNAGDYDKFTAYAGNQVGAKNERCTNYVLVAHKNAKKIEICSMNCVGGGVAGRTEACVSVDWRNGQSTRLVSWHSLASKCSLDTSHLFDELQKASHPNTIIGADFNDEWAEVESILLQKEESRSGKNNIRARVRKKTSGPATHPGSSKDLDFFVVMGVLASKEQKVKCIDTGTRVDGTNISDHNPVIFEFDL